MFSYWSGNFLRVFAILHCERLVLRCKFNVIFIESPKYAMTHRPVYRRIIVDAAVLVGKNCMLCFSMWMEYFGLHCAKRRLSLSLHTYANICANETSIYTYWLCQSGTIQYTILTECVERNTSRSSIFPMELTAATLISIKSRCWIPCVLFSFCCWSDWNTIWIFHFLYKYNYFRINIDITHS